MDLPDIIAIVLIIAVVGGAIAYIVKAKKNGHRCIGCPDSDCCNGCCAACPSACDEKEKEDECPFSKIPQKRC